MKRILLFFTLLVFVFQVEGQSIIRANPYHKAVVSTGYTARSSDYQAVYNAYTVKPDAGDALIDDDMVFSLDSAGFWDRMVRMWVTAAHVNTNGEAYIQWKSPGTDNITDPGSTSPTFTAWEGIDWDGSSDYLSLNFNPSTDGGLIFVLDDATMMVYIRENVDVGAAVMGVRAAGNYSRVYPRSSGDMAALVNSGGSCITTNATSAGLIAATRTASNAVMNLRAAASLGTDTDLSTALPNGDMFLGSYNLVGTGPTTFYTGEVAIVILMDGIDATDMGKINTIIERRMDRHGKGVQ